MFGRTSNQTSTLPGDVGDVLLDEIHAVVLRRQILGGGEVGQPITPKVRPDSLEDKVTQHRTEADALKDLSALCLSGGGIRSAAFALGVIQVSSLH
jgi:hypothetical protein